MSDKKDRARQLGELLEWVDQALAQGRVPRLSDVLEYAYKQKGFRGLPRGDVARALRLHPAYQMNSAQQRERLRSRKYRPIVTNGLGHLHADIGFFSRSDDYETPKTFRAGFLIAKDILSRYTYGVLLRGNRKAESMVAAFGELFEHHRSVFGNGHAIVSVSFDQERSVVSHTLQAFLAKNNVAFHAFAHSSSKAKHAESAIRLVRNALKRLQLTGKEKRWWHLFPLVVAGLNERPIRVNQRTLSWRPLDVRIDNLEAFLTDLYKHFPLQYHAQFPVAPSLVDFRFAKGDFVRTKTVVTSSQVLGQKRSELTLDSDLYEVLDTLAYLTAAGTTGKAYRVVHVVTGQEDTFDEHDLAEALPPGTARQA